MAIRYEEESGKKAIQNLVPNKYKLRFGDAVIDMKGVDIHVHREWPEIVLDALSQAKGP